jgi:hypothetical protein
VFAGNDDLALLAKLLEGIFEFGQITAGYTQTFGKLCGPIGAVFPPCYLFEYLFFVYFYHP